MYRTRNLLILFSLLCSVGLMGQVTHYFTVTEISTPDGPEYKFVPNYGAIADDYPLIPGHPLAEYQFFWIFGDGTFSYEDEPTHKYAQGGNYEITMTTTPAYSPSEPPPRAEMIISNVGSNSSATGVYIPTDLVLRKDRRPKALNPNIYAVAYKNTTGTTISNAEILFYYNTSHFIPVKDYLQNGESFVDQNAYNGLNYDIFRRYDVGTLAPDETRIMFIELLATPAVEANGSFPPLYIQTELRDGTTLIAQVEEVTVAVSGWDPNVFSFTEPDRVYYSEWPTEEHVIFKVDFENYGTSTVTAVSVNSKLSDFLDFSSLTLLDYYPDNVVPIFDKDPATREFSCEQTGVHIHGTRDPAISSESGPGVIGGTSGYYIFSAELLHQSNYDPVLFDNEGGCEPYFQIDGSAEIIMDYGAAIPTNEATLDFFEEDNPFCSPPTPCNLDIRIFPDPIFVGGKLSIEVNNLPSEFNPDDVSVEFVEILTGNTVSHIQEMERKQTSNQSLRIRYNINGGNAGLYNAVVSYVNMEPCSELFVISN